MNYPLSWNNHQEWLFGFVGTKTTFNFIYAHKFFFQDLIDDWFVGFFILIKWNLELNLDLKI